MPAGAGALGRLVENDKRQQVVQQKQAIELQEKQLLAGPRNFYKENHEFCHRMADLMRSRRRGRFPVEA